MTILLPLVAGAYTGEAVIDGIKYSINTNTQTAKVVKDNYSGEIIIPETVDYEGVACSVTTIASSAFSGCKALISVQIPNSVITIETWAFYQCSELSSVTIGDNVTSIAYSAFSGCKSITSIRIPDSVTSIGTDVFSDCKGLISVVIGHGLTSISQGTFKNCTSLVSVDIPDNVEKIGNSAFYGCSALSSISMGNGITSIGGSAFSGCLGLTSILIPNSVTTIGTFAFLGCDALTTLIIGSGVESIGTYAFSQCKALTKVFCYSNNVPATSNNAFSNSNISKATLYVLEDSIDAYKASSSWNGFKEYLPVPKVTYMVDDVIFREEIVVVTTPFIPIVEPEKEGYTFSGWIDVPKTMPMNDVVIKGYFTINTYILTYLVDNKVYKEYEVVYDSDIEPEAEPVKEGHTFSGWSEIPAKMPAKNVIVTGTFTINSYMLTYMVDGEVYKECEVVYDSAIEPEAEPVKEGHTFSGWSEIPVKMPAKDVTVTGSFTINSYTLTYILNGEVYKQYKHVYGSVIEAEADPVKEGYTFSGWGDIPATMPAKDVSITGTLTINKYKLTYFVDSEEYKSYEIEYGAVITPEVEPEKKGYTFSGWSYIPNTMPAEDVTVIGSFEANEYHLTYIVDGDIYKEYDVKYDTAITPETEPTKEGYTFSGWSYIPSKMPAEDVTVIGKFRINSYTVTYMLDGEVYTTETLEYGAKIVPPVIPGLEDYTIWEDVPETMPAKDIIIYGKAKEIIDGLDSEERRVKNKEDIMIYDLNGHRLASPQKGINMIRVGNGITKKVLIK